MTVEQTIARCEPMSSAFTKWHLDAPAVLHRFTAPDSGDPHDHPFGFTTQILSGGYVEEVYTLTADGGWSVSLHHRWPGTSHHVEATTVHRIVALPQGECWTVIRPGPWERKSGFWRVVDGRAQFRAWDEPWPEKFARAA